VAEIQQMTGFQSPCSEYAEDNLSLDQRFLFDRPGMFFVRASNNYPLFRIEKNDLLLIHRGQHPKHGQNVIAVISDNFVIAKFQLVNGIGLLMPFSKKIGDVENGDDFIWGIISSIHRDSRK
jgi:DNA polymerase V